MDSHLFLFSKIGNPETSYVELQTHTCPDWVEGCILLIEEDFRDISDYIFLFFTLDDDVIHIYFDISINLHLKNPIHYPLVYSLDII